MNAEASGDKTSNLQTHLEVHHRIEAAKRALWRELWELREAKIKERALQKLDVIGKYLVKFAV